MSTGAPPAPWGARLVLGCLALTALMFRQAPGLVVPDTKLDLTADPVAFLSRSLHLWDPHGFFGQLQNQAYGYLLPVGPFHALLIELGLPAWVVQRLWWSVVLCVAFLGTWKLARALGMGTPWAAYAAAFAYALTPRMLSEVTITSVEVWPMAMAPWVLLPLVSRAPLSWWQRIWRSAVAVALVGGVNAVATGAVLVLPTLWFLTRRWTRETLLALLGWLAAVIVAMAWWLVPLLVMGTHSPPFLDWIESAAVTTLVAAPSEALRGTSHWLGYLSTSSGPSWPGGRQYVDSSLLVAGSVVIALVGLLALIRSRTPHRLFLAVGVGTGLVLVTAGHTGAVSGVLAAPVQDLLDAGLAALRNTHKFEPVVRLPLVLLLASALTQLARWSRQAQLHRVLVPFVAACAVVVVAAPALASTLPRAGGHEQLAPHWQSAADWLDAQPDDGTVLVVPAASFADFTWGSTRDEPLQSLMERPFAVRDAVPLGGAGSTRWLDEIQRRLGSGDGGPDLAQALARGGVGWVVVRNDLALTANLTPQIAPHQALVAAGLERVADFGPPVGPVGESDSHTVRQRTIVPTPSVQIYAVPDPSTARLAPLADTMRLTGGPEDVPGLAGLAPAYLLHGDDDQADLDGVDLERVDLSDLGGTVVSDGYRRRAVNFGRAADNLSGMMTADAPMPDRRVNDYVVPGLGDRAPITWPAPIAAVTASSSASDADVLGRAGPGYDPWAALDGDPGTTWLSGDLGSPQGQWWQVDFTQPQDLGPRLSVRLSSSAFFAPVQSWRVVTDAGSEATAVDADVLDQELTVPDGPTTTLRIVAASVPAGTVTGAALAEVDLPGITPVAPDLQVLTAGGHVDVVSLRAQQLGRSACLMLGQRPLCAGLQAQPMEEPTGLHRTLSLDVAGTYAVHGQVMPVDGAPVEEVLRAADQVTVSASSRDVFAAYGRPDAVVDGDEGTGWVAGVLDRAPTLTLELPQERELSGLRVSSDYFLPASRPSELSVSLDGGEPMDLVIGANGEVGWDPVEVSEVVVTFGASFTVTTSDPLVPGPARGLPVGVSELTLLGDGDFPVPDPDRDLALPCGSGPDVLVNGVTVRTQVTGTAREVLERDRLDWRSCDDAGSVSLDASDNQISAVVTTRWVPVGLTLIRDSFDAARAPATPLELTRPTPAEAAVDVPARAEDSLVVLAQNFGSGWSGALIDDEGVRTQLEPLVVDGWQQGFVVPAGTAGTLEARFGPDGTYRLGLGLGFGALLLLWGAGLFWRPKPRADGVHLTRPRSAAVLTLPARAALIGLFAVALAGLWGLLAGVLAGVLLTLVAPRTAGERGSALTVAVPALTGLIGAALLAWAGPRPTGSDLVAVLPQVLVVLTIVLVFAAAAVTDLPAHRAPQPRPRSAGGVSGGSRPADPSP